MENQSSLIKDRPVKPLHKRQKEQKDKKIQVPHSKLTTVGENGGSAYHILPIHVYTS